MRNVSGGEIGVRGGGEAGRRGRKEGMDGMGVRDLFECVRQDKACYAGADDEDGVPFSSRGLHLA
jgi:hypothetical protein